MKKPTIIVIGSADVIKLGLIRSLGELGYKVISIHLGRECNSIIKPLDYYSKYVSSYYFSERTNLIDLLIHKCTDHDFKPILFPLDDDSVFLIDQAHHILKKDFLYAHIKNKEFGIIELMDKSIQKQKASEVGLDVVKGWVIPFSNGKFEIPSDIEYPCFIKGLKSYISSKNVQRRYDNKEKLLAFLDELRLKHPYPLLAEQYIEIDKEFGFMAFSDGEHHLIPAKVDLLEMGEGTTHGVSMYGYITPLSAFDLHYKAIETFLNLIDYVGICNFDFIESHGKLFFVELNFRYAAYGYGLSKTGVNLPSIYIRQINKMPISESEDSMSRSIYYFNEKIGLLNVIEGRMTWKDYFSTKKKATCLFVASRKDPIPYFVFLVKYFGKYVKSRIYKIIRH